EILRYVPGFTRIESSGGEVNENIGMRGILGVEYVMFMEDGLPVFPTMHTFFMNADNLFRMDENIERAEVVRGAGSALFGSNTPGALINFINRTGGPEVRGTLKAYGGTGDYARTDFNVNGPVGPDWRFNIGGFYRYNRGARDPGFPGTSGGQLKASLTRNFTNGYFRTSLKVIDVRNQFILDLPFMYPDTNNLKSYQNVPGFSDYGSMNTNEGNNVTVPTPDGQLTFKKAYEGGHNVSLGAYFANYSQTNQWYFTDILMDVRDNPHFVDLRVDSADVYYHYRNRTTAANDSVLVPVRNLAATRNGFRRFVSNYVNGEGQTTVFSGVLGGSFRLSNRVRADVGVRYENDAYVQTSQNTATIPVNGDTLNSLNLFNQ